MCEYVVYYSVGLETSIEIFETNEQKLERGGCWLGATF